jgi:hypothetical protein
MTTAELEHLSAEKLMDAETLFINSRWEGAHYLCGYATELKLKARICKILGWVNYETGDGYTSFKTHKLPILLNLSSRDSHIRTQFKAEWNTVSQWNPEMRYDANIQYNQSGAKEIIDATKILLNQL